MNKEGITNFINEHKESDDFTGGVDESQINVVQNELGVELPESYKWFLTTYGSGGAFGVDILGVAKSNRAPVVVNTNSYRDLGFDKDIVVIENAGEYVYCLYTSKMENNECPVIAWNRQKGDLMTTIQQRTFMSIYHKGYWMQKKHGKKIFKIDN